MVDEGAHGEQAGGVEQPGGHGDVLADALDAGGLVGLAAGSEDVDHLVAVEEGDADVAVGLYPAFELAADGGLARGGEPGEPDRRLAPQSVSHELNLQRQRSPAARAVGASHVAAQVRVTFGEVGEGLFLGGLGGEGEGAKPGGLEEGL